jgi:hypothetical protein
MRELVGLKVGLEYIRDAEDDQQRKSSAKKELLKRRKMSTVYRMAI